MFWTILALALMVGMGGFIAYYGDVQGTRWGKRKKLLFGRLRPRYTASLIATLTGAFIAAMSIITLLAISQPLREVVLRGESSLHSLHEQNAAQKRQLLDAQNRIRDMDERVQVAQANLDFGNRRLLAQEEQKNRLDKQFHVLQKNLHILQENLEQTGRKLAANKAELSRAQAANRRLGETNADLGRQNQSMERQVLTLGKDKKGLEASKQNLEKVKLKLTLDIQTLTKEREKQEHDKEAAEEANKQLLASIDMQAQQNAELKTQSDDLKRQITDMNQQIDDLRQKYSIASSGEATAANSYLALREGKFNLRMGAELGRRTLDAHLRPEAVRREVQTLLADASALAQAHGATPGPNGRAVRIISKRLETTTGTLTADENDSVNALASEDGLAGSDTPIVLVARAVSNSVEGEQVVIELTPYFVRHIFDKGQEVASFQINARQPADRIFDGLVHFLNTEVRNAVLKAGTVPRTDPDTGEQAVGSIEPSVLLNLTDRIRRMRGQVVVTASAAEQTTSADPIRLTFKLARPPAKLPTTP